MENQANLSADPQRDGLLNTFCEITSASKSEALFFLESHNFDLDSAVSTFFENNSLPVPADVDDNAPASAATNLAARSPSRSRSPSPPRPRNPPTSSSGATGRRTGGIHTFSDLNRRAVAGSGSDSDEPQEYYTGGEKSGMLVQDPSKASDVDAIFDQARRHAAPPPDSLPSSSARSFIGTARRLTGETLSATPAPPPESVTHTINLWTNGFTIDDGPLRRFDDPENASFLESIRKSECPQELQPEDRRTSVRVNLTRREEDCPVPEKCHVPFQGVGRTLGSTSNADKVESTGAVSSFMAAPAPSVGLVVDQSQPSTSIQLRLADGTRMVSRFNVQHTIRDIRGFIDASRPGGSRSYQLQTVGFPPKQLSDLNLTIEQAGLANSVVIQKL